jgi:hypothetical protein
MSDWRQPQARGVAARLLALLRRGHHEVPVSDASDAGDACHVCGEPTAAGSVLYSDRVAIVRSDGSPAFRCAECDARARGAATDALPADGDVGKIADNAVMIGANLLGGGGT